MMRCSTRLRSFVVQEMEVHLLVFDGLGLRGASLSAWGARRLPRCRGQVRFNPDWPSRLDQGPQKDWRWPAGGASTATGRASFRAPRHKSTDFRRTVTQFGRALSSSTSTPVRYRD